MFDVSNLPQGIYIKQYYIVSSSFKIYVANHPKFNPNWMPLWKNLCFYIATCIEYMSQLFNHNYARYDVL